MTVLEVGEANWHAEQVAGLPAPPTIILTSPIIDAVYTYESWARRDGTLRKVPGFCQTRGSITFFRRY